jgi:hypothetical protein
LIEYKKSIEISLVDKTNNAFYIKSVYLSAVELTNVSKTTGEIKNCPSLAINDLYKNGCDAFTDALTREYQLYTNKKSTGEIHLTNINNMLILFSDFQMDFIKSTKELNFIVAKIAI